MSEREQYLREYLDVLEANARNCQAQIQQLVSQQQELLNKRDAVKALLEPTEEQ